MLKMKPMIDSSVFVAKSAEIMGDVRIGAQSSVWFQTVIRADIAAVHIGERSNIQDGTIIHVDYDQPCVIGSDVTIGHRCVLHGCTIEDGCLIGMGAVILNGAVIKKGALVAAGAVVKEGMIVESNTLVAGVPAKGIKILPDDTYAHHVQHAAAYCQLAKEY